MSAEVFWNIEAILMYPRFEWEMEGHLFNQSALFFTFQFFPFAAVFFALSASLPELSLQHTKPHFSCGSLPFTPHSTRYPLPTVVLHFTASAVMLQQILC